MKQKIHPTYHDKITVTCACGNAFVTGSTEKELAVEVCSACHPFYTGKKKLVDTAGRVDRFAKLLKASAAKQSKQKSPKARKTTPRSHTKKAGTASKVVKLG